MTVELVTTSSPEIVEAMERLIPQLSRSAPALTAEQCEALIAQEGVFLFVFRPEAEAGQSAPILGMLTLATFTIPTGRGAPPHRPRLCPDSSGRWGISPLGALPGGRLQG